MSLSKSSGDFIVKPCVVLLESTMLNGILVIQNVLYVGAGIVRYSNETHKQSS